MKISKTDLAYFAGLMDGEGCFSLRNPRGKSITPIVQIKMKKAKKLIKYFHKIFGGSYYIERTKLYYGNNYVIHWTHRKEIKYLLKQIIPFLRLKQKQAKVVMDFLPLLNCHGYNKSLTQKEINARQKLYLKIRYLNRRSRKRKEE